MNLRAIRPVGAIRPAVPITLRIVGILFGLTVATCFAQDPPPVVKPAIIVPMGVKGDGRQKTPYQFDGTSVCVVELPASVVLTDEKPEDVWDLDDGPPGAVLIGGNRICVFPLEPAGVYQVTARATGFYSKIWFRTKGPNGPPPPVPGPEPDPVPNLSDNVTAAFVGPFAKADADKFRGICDALAELLEGDSLKETADLFDSYAAAFSGSNKLQGKYPALAEILRKVLPAAGDSTPMDDAERARWRGVFRKLSDGAKAVASTP